MYLFRLDRIYLRFLVTNQGEQSVPTELKSGDTLEFGVDIKDEQGSST
jgi:hypothetical protein